MVSILFSLLIDEWAKVMMIKLNIIIHNHHHHDIRHNMFIITINTNLVIYLHFWTIDNNKFITGWFTFGLHIIVAYNNIQIES